MGVRAPPEATPENWGPKQGSLLDRHPHTSRRDDLENPKDKVFWEPLKHPSPKDRLATSISFHATILAIYQPILTIYEYLSF